MVEQKKPIYSSFNNFKKLKGVEPLGKNEKLYVFDLDYTLYPFSLNFVEEIEYSFCQFLEDFLRKKVDKNDLNDLEKELPDGDGCLFRRSIEKYNVTKNDLKNLHDKVNFQKKLFKDEELIKIFENLNGRLFIMTNGIRYHIESCLKKMEIEHFFEYIIFCDPFEPKRLCKPMFEAFESINKTLNIKNKENVLFFDDSLKNINAANKSGWTSYLVTENNEIKDILLKNFNNNS